MKKFIPLLAFLVLAWFLFDGLGRDTKTLPSPLIGKDFPDLVVVDFDTNQSFKIQDKLQNKISLVNVWASWCSTCRAEHDVLMAIHNSNILQMIGINYKDEKEEGKKFLNAFKNPFDFIIFDDKGKLGLELGVYATPETFIIDKLGIIRFKHIGELTPYIWKNDIIPLINNLNKNYDK